MQKLLNSFSINRDAGGSIPMIDPLDETIASLRRRIEQFKKEHPELYKSESNERERNTYSSKATELKKSLLSKTQSTKI
jgi:Sec-independent protein translocase protein TatA|tara:strand:+ start:162 stop:398 length:237 start_codon:yes stop_codon:yes gene_type:complete